MIISIPSELESALEQVASRHGVTPEQWIVDTVRTTLAITSPTPADAWEELLFNVGSPAGVSLSDDATSRNCIYD
jgi:hypothetical protein